ncbi:MAG: ROK family glucokinase [Lachnospiraceae bacterium]|nr:ROK family glucokinase [Lachnospiraceae bacterium]
MKYLFGADIGGTTVKLGLFSEAGDILDKWEIRTDRSNGGENVPADVVKAVNDKITEKNIDRKDVLGLGVGVPGPIKADGTVLKCANLGWGIFNVTDKFTELLGLPVKAGNDANVAALGEMWKGGGMGYQDIVMVTLGTGVGGGVILDGRIRAGEHGGAGEIGHIRVNENETRLCGCGGHGHLEQYASATGVAYLGTEAAKKNPDSLLAKEPAISAKTVFDCAKKGDKVALQVVDDMCEMLVIALSHVAATVDPQCFVIGGGVSKAGDILVDTLKKHYGKNMLNALQTTEIKLATLGNDAGIYGCARMVLDGAK